MGSNKQTTKQKTRLGKHLKLKLLFPQRSFFSLEPCVSMLGTRNTLISGSKRWTQNTHSHTHAYIVRNIGVPNFMSSKVSVAVMAANMNEYQNRIE